MELSEKKKLIKKTEFKVKLLQLRIKYSKNLWETIGLTIQIGIEISQVTRVLATPRPRPISLEGGAIFNKESRQEVVIFKSKRIPGCPGC